MKGAKGHPEFTCVHFGINWDTFAVDIVWQRSDRVPSCYGVEHKVGSGSSAKAALRKVFGLADIRTLPFQMFAASGGEARQELEEFAQRRRSARIAG